MPTMLTILVFALFNWNFPAFDILTNLFLIDQAYFSDLVDIIYIFFIEYPSTTKLKKVKEKVVFEENEKNERIHP